MLFQPVKPWSEPNSSDRWTALHLIRSGTSVRDYRIQWRPGEVIVFEDTLEPEAYNGSDSLRTVLIFGVWNPLLSADDRAIVLTTAAAARTYGGA